MDRFFLRTNVLARYLLFTYVAIILNCLGYLSGSFDDVSTGIFSASILLVYPAIYLLPTALTAGLIGWTRRKKNRFNRVDGFLLAAAVLVAALTQIAIYADRTVFGMFDFHLNGFVWNLIRTPGGIESMGGDSSTTIAYALIITGLVVLQAMAMLAAVWSARFPLVPRPLRRRAVAYGLVGFWIVCLLFQGAAYGLGNFYCKTGILAAARSMPLYVPVTFRHAAEKFGLTPAPRPKVKLSLDENSGLRYPLRVIERKATATNYNIVWLTAESLRADMVTPEIMPSTCRFAEQSQWFRTHYSGGNGTRMGMFSMFYGLYGSYWFKFLDNRRGPVLIDLLRSAGYQFSLYSSARFSYPEFDRIMFADIPAENLHDGLEGPGWQRDRMNVAAMLDWLDRRDPDRPFMAFMFFESPHARYYFPEECAIRKPYLEKFNYATADIAKDIELIRNRYINACYHLDTQYARVLEYLKQHDLLDSTIVILTGDHGEEFMENGRWGHNSAFNEQQTRTPLILHYPGCEPAAVTRLTSHLDIAPTLMTLLGVVNKPEDYSLGHDLLGDRNRAYAVFNDWDSIGIADQRYKATFPLDGVSGGMTLVTTADDRQETDPSALFNERPRLLVELIGGMTRFNGRDGNDKPSGTAGSVAVTHP